jgi:hypothetical protein
MGLGEAHGPLSRTPSKRLATTSNRLKALQPSRLFVPCCERWDQLSDRSWRSCRNTTAVLSPPPEDGPQTYPRGRIAGRWLVSSRGASAPAAPALWAGSLKAITQELHVRRSGYAPPRWARSSGDELPVCDASSVVCPGAGDDQACGWPRSGEPAAAVWPLSSIMRPASRTRGGNGRVRASDRDRLPASSEDRASAGAR